MISSMILNGVINSKSYARQVLPHIKKEYFETIEEKDIFNEIKKYIINFNHLPSKEEILIEIGKNEKLTENHFNSIVSKMEDIFKINKIENIEWLLTNTESWCKERALRNALIESVDIMSENKRLGQIPDLLTKALSVGFDTKIGIEYYTDAGIQTRWDSYHTVNKKFPVGVISLDNIMGGGPEPKSLSIIMSGTNCGKTSSMIGFASNMVRSGFNCLYLTLEMSEEKIAQRADANMLDIDINDIPLLEEKMFKSKLNELKSKNHGRFFIKEYPPATITTSTIRHLLGELKIKGNFIPDVVFVDYLNLMLSDRVSKDTSYTIVKSIAEELRGLAVENELCIISATQGNRETNAADNSDIGITQMSESVGLAFTADAIWGVIFPSELREQNTQIWKILKNRFSGIVDHKVPVKVNFARAKIYDEKDEDIKISSNSKSNSIKLRSEENRQKKKNEIVVEIDDIVENPVDELLLLID